eukprot:TRINITY_DN3271_c0_g1::TRINITY_DN3271_c0_g1_i1::g.29718::m.29718 TRINITY_DN3271_c0_g1::TRINITY_DN3271_c0_g1_i1::g.29718  ORF type:complete len:362 (+),score=5.45 TRINITY_DN3271_c0_g1_i1:85-1086(+)
MVFQPMKSECILEILKELKPRARLLVVTQDSTTNELQEEEVQLVNFNPFCKPPFFFAKIFKPASSREATAQTVKYVVPELYAVHVVDVHFFLKFVHQGKRVVRKHRVTHGLTTQAIQENVQHLLHQYIRDYLDTEAKVTDVIHRPDQGLGHAVFTRVEFEGQIHSCVSKDSFCREKSPELFALLTANGRASDLSFSTICSKSQGTLFAIVKTLSDEAEWNISMPSSDPVEKELDVLETSGVPSSPDPHDSTLPYSYPYSPSRVESPTGKENQPGRSSPNGNVVNGNGHSEPSTPERKDGRERSDSGKRKSLTGMIVSPIKSIFQKDSSPRTDK